MTALKTSRAYYRSSAWDRQRTHLPNKSKNIPMVSVTGLLKSRDGVQPGLLRAVTANVLEKPPLRSAAREIFNHRCDGSGQVLARVDVQELVWPVGVAFGSQNACDQELRLGKLFAEHSHEGNRATLTERARARAEESG